MNDNQDIQDVQEIREVPTPAPEQPAPPQPKAKVLIATPMYGGMCTGDYARSLAHLPIMLNANNVDVSFAFIFNNSLVQSARNSLADIFMRHDFTHLMFIDADIRYNPQDVLGMLWADKDVLCGVYPKKEINWGLVEHAVKQGVTAKDLTHFTGSLVVNLTDYAKEQEVKVNEPVEVTAGGTGFMLIKKRVLQKLVEHVDSYLDDAGNEISEFFFLMKDPVLGKQLSEDYAFCYKCREHGIKIHVAPWVRLGHTGTYTFEGSVIPTNMAMPVQNK